jgi:hypothetical protein
VQSDLIGRGFGLLHEIPDQLGMLLQLSKWAARIDPTETRVSKPALGIVADAKAALAALQGAVERHGGMPPLRRAELEALKAATSAELTERLGPQCAFSRRSAPNCRMTASSSRI